MKREEALQLLREEPVFWSRLGFCYDPPRAGKDGKQIIFSRNFSRYQKTHDAFSAIGVDLHSGIIHSGWIGDNQYDYEAADTTIQAVLEGHPERWYIPRVKLNVPVDWCRNHPEEVFVYYGGPETPEEIAAMVGTPLHDWFGGDTGNGYPVNGGYYQDDRPNVGGMIGLQSFSSQKWLEDAGEALRRFLDHMEKGPYGKQILAYHIAFGCCGETTLWGAWRNGGENRRGDYGIGHRHRFYRWAVAHYGSEAALRAAWGIPDLTEENFRLPPPNERESQGQSLEQMFQDQLLPDYYDFLSECSASAVEYFGRIVHESCDKPAGAFYGYLVVPQAPYAGHLHLQQILNSPHVDFLASPRSYKYCVAGEPGGEQVPSQTFNRKKIWMDELDNWTHLDILKRADAAKNMAETRTVLWREVAKNLSYGQNFWWMDLGEGWFDDSAIMKELSDLYQLTARLRKRPRKSTAQVLAVVDEEGIQYSKISYGLAQGLRERLLRELRLCGTMVDQYCQKDLLEMDLSQYRFVVFLTPFAQTYEQWQKIQDKLAAGTTVLWNYAAGIRGGTFDVDRVRRLTGFSVKSRDGDPCSKCYSDIPLDFPALSISPQEGAEILMRAESGDAVLARSQDGKRYLASEPVLRVPELREMMRQAGVRMTAPEYCTVYEDSRFTAVFSKKDIDGKITFPSAGDFRELSTGQKILGAERTSLSLAAKDFVFFEQLTDTERL